MRTKQDDRGVAHFDAVVLQDEASGGAGNCRGGTGRDSDGAGKPARRILQLDEKHPGLDAVTAVVVGAPDSGVVLQGKQARHRGTRGSGKMRGVRIRKAGAGSRCSGHVVQLRAVALFDNGLAREHGGLQDLLSNEPVNHRI